VREREDGITKVGDTLGYWISVKVLGKMCCRVFGGMVTQAHGLRLRKQLVGV